VSAWGTGGHGFDSLGPVKPMTLKIVVMDSLLGAQELGLALRLIRWCWYKMTGLVLVPGVPNKPQGDPKPEELSLNGALLPKMAVP